MDRMNSGTKTNRRMWNLVQQQLHTASSPIGWTALHYAAAAHKVKLVAQLLWLGADPAAVDAVNALQPLHLACMGRVKDQKQLGGLLAAAGALYDLQVGRGLAVFRV